MSFDQLTAVSGGVGMPPMTEANLKEAVEAVRRLVKVQKERVLVCHPDFLEAMWQELPLPETSLKASSFSIDLGMRVVSDADCEPTEVTVTDWSHWLRCGQSIVEVKRRERERVMQQLRLVLCCILAQKYEVTAVKTNEEDLDE